MNLKNSSNNLALLTVLTGYSLLLLAVCLWPYNVSQANGGVWQKGGGLKFTSPGTAYTESEVSALAGLSQYTLMLHFTPDNPGETSWILSHGVDFERANILVGLNSRQLIVRAARNGRYLLAGLSGLLERGESVWLAVVLDSMGMSVYVDGRERRTVQSPLSPLSVTPQQRYPLVIGSRGDGKFPWDGVMFQFAVFDRVCSVEEIQNPELLIRSGKPIVHYDFNSGSGAVIQNMGSGSSGSVIIPPEFSPLRRPMLMDFEETWNPYRIWGDMVLNVLAFIPFGFMLSELLCRRVGIGMMIAISLAAVFSFSLGIEVLQSFLPKRWSTFTDVATNTIGGLLGIALHRSGVASPLMARFNLFKPAASQGRPAAE